MIDREYLYSLIKNGYECEFLDFKKVQYQRENFQNLIIDVMSMANSSYSGDKYIIIGIKDKTDGSREIFSIPRDDFLDSSVYQNLISDNIEPELNIEYFPLTFENEMLGVIKIHSSNNDKPYILKKQYKTLNVGLCKIRKGSTNTYAMRRDFDNFYSLKEHFEVRLMKNSLFAIYDEEGCAVTTVTIRNLTKKPIVINWGLLSIESKGGELLSEHRVYGFDKKIIGADFNLSLAPMEEKLGELYVSFGSTDCLRLGIDEHGYTDKRFTFKLTLADTYDNEYSCYIGNCMIIVKGSFLWKVQLKSKKGVTVT